MRLAFALVTLAVALPRLPAAGTVTLVAADATIVQPFAIDFDADGRVVFVEMAGGERLRRVTKEGKVETLAGTGKKGLAPAVSPADKAEFNGMHALAIDRAGLVYLADTFNHAISTYDPATKTVTRVAGTGTPGFAGDGGPAAAAKFNQAINIAFNADQSLLYVADIGNRRVRVIDVKSKTIRTFAGTGAKGTPKPGEPATTQPLTDPRAVAVDAAGNVYILERGGHRLYRVGTDGKILAVAGTGKAGKGGDGGPALQAAMNGPKFLCIDRDESVLIADTENHQVRRYDPKSGAMTLVAGSGTAGGKFDADPTKLELKRPHGVTVHPKTGDIFIADSDNGRLLKLPR